jgi:DNA-binding transcriptional MerR regulator
MANGGGGDWWDTAWQLGQGAIAAIASAASAAVGWMAYRYRHYVRIVSKAHHYVEMLKEVKTRSRIVRHEQDLRRIKKIMAANDDGRVNARAIEECRRQIGEVAKEVDKQAVELAALNDEVDKLSRACDRWGHVLETQGDIQKEMAREFFTLRDAIIQRLPGLLRFPEKEQ